MRTATSQDAGPSVCWVSTSLTDCDSSKIHKAKNCGHGFMHWKEVTIRDIPILLEDNFNVFYVNHWMSSFFKRTMLFPLFHSASRSIYLFIYFS